MLRPVVARCFFVFLLGCAGIGAIPAHADAGDTNLKLERETFNLVNQYRTSEQLPPFTWDARIAQVARGHSKEMADGTIDFGHAGFSSRVSRLRNELPGMMGCGENVLMTSDPSDAARSAVALWLKSPAHLRNIRGEFKLSGLGVRVNAEGVIYFTQIFVKIAAESAEAN